MLDSLYAWWHNRPFSDQWLYSLLLIPTLLILRSVLLKLHFRSRPHLDIEEKRRLLVVSRNMTLIACLLGLLAVWAAQIQTFALSMVALAAATVLATKELIMCLSGSLLRAVTKQYSVGDFIEINHIRGRVVDINLLNTLMMQIGPHPQIGQLSGKTVSFPNSLLLSFPVQRDNILGRFVVHTFDIPVPIHLDADALVPPLAAVLREKCAPFAAEAAAHLEAVQEQQLFITPAAEARISRVPDNDKNYVLVVRFASPVAQRLEIQQAVLDEFIRLQHRLLKPH
ncbi:MAG: mechanosensitive ion channel family protein [Eikenella sp.]|nr:mechanosensitive ion channel family protein [Eikenella sp.]